MSGKNADGATPFPSRPPAPRHTSSNPQTAGMSPSFTNFPPRGGSPAVTPQGMDDSRPTSAYFADSEIPTPTNPGDLDSLPISDEQKARIIERQ
jgi:hypothetical protein